MATSNPTAESAGSGRDRRKRRRIPARLKVEAQLGNRTVNCRSVDLSATGLHFQARERLADGSRIAVRVFFGNNRSSTFDAVVRRCEAMEPSGDIYDIGVEFAREGAATLLVDYLDGKLNPAGHAPDSVGRATGGHRSVGGKSFLDRYDAGGLGLVGIVVVLALVVVILIAVAT